MSRFLRVLSFSLAALLALASLTACGTTAETLAPGVPAPGISIDITPGTCSSIEINAGEQVTWTNAGSEALPLAVLYEDGETMIDLGELQPGDSASATFPEAGEFTYTCSAGGESMGMITVNEGP